MASQIPTSQAVVDPSNPTIDVERPNYVGFRWVLKPDGTTQLTLVHKFPKKRKANGQIRF